VPSDTPPRISTRYLAIAVTLLGLSAAAYFFLGRGLVEAVYYGRLPALAGLLKGGAAQGVAFYLRVFDKLALMAFAVELLAVVFVGVAGGWLRFGAESTEWLVVAGAIVGVVFAIYAFGAITGPVVYAGDGVAYFPMAQSFAAHGTPDLRSEDIARFTTERMSHDIVGDPPLNQFHQSPVNSLWYSDHFWGYSLVSVPVRLLLTLFGFAGMKAFEVLNLLLFFGSVVALLLLADLSAMQRAVFASLLVLSPMTWYIPWSSTEVYTAALVVISIVFFTRKQLALATLFAALASTQNQPLLLLAAAYGGYAVIQLLPKKRYAEMGRVVLCGLVAFIPMVFYYATFHLMSLQAQLGFAGWDNVTMARITGFFFDLDQGLLPYLPLVTIVFFIAVVAAIIRLDWWTIARALAVLGMVVLSATTARGWNSASIGLMRYAVWMLPVVVWVVVDALGSGRGYAFAAATLVTVQLATLFISLAVSQPVANVHSLFGRIALARVPWSYSPPAEQFVARTTGLDISATEFQPVAFSTGGTITKVLADREHLAKLGDYLDIDPAVAAALKSSPSDASGFYYVNLKAGQATVRTQETTVEPLPYPMTAIVGGPTSLGPSDEKAESDRYNRFPRNASGRTIVAPLASYPLFVTVRNSSDTTWYPEGAHALGITVDILDKSGRPAPGSKPIYYPLVQAVFPGEVALMYPVFVTPAREGAFTVAATFVQADENGQRVAVPGTKTDAPITVQPVPPMRREP